MNKKVKFIAPILCGVVLSSGLVLTNVQAATAKDNAKNNTQINSIADLKNTVAAFQNVYGEKIASGTFTPYFQLNKEQIVHLADYCRSRDKTVFGVRNMLMQCGASQEMANNMESYIDLMAGGSRPEIFHFSDGVIILSQDGQENVFTMAPMTKYGMNEKYTLNYALTANNGSYLVNHNSNTSFQQALDAVINGKITDDKEIQNNIAQALYNYPNTIFSDDSRACKVLKPSHSDASCIIVTEPRESRYVRF